MARRLRAASRWLQSRLLPGAWLRHQHSVTSKTTILHSVDIPGCIRGWQAMHRRHGKRSLNKHLDPAIRFAASGFPMQEMIGRVWDSELVCKDHEGLRVFYANGKAPQVGDIYRNPDLAKAILMKSQNLGGLLSPPDL